VLGERGADPGPGGGDGLCPAPGGIDTQPQLAGAAGDAGGHVQDPVAERLNLAAGQLGVVGESDEFGPGNQIGCGQDDFEPGRVGLKGIVKLFALVWRCQDWSLWRLRRGTRATGIRSRSSGTRCGCIRFALSLRDVDELMLARGVAVTSRRSGLGAPSSGRTMLPGYVVGDPVPAISGTLTRCS
jgi:hypothetical protein